jgi:fatty acid desaturase
VLLRGIGALSQPSTFPLFKDAYGAFANTLAMAYALLGTAAGFVLMAEPHVVAAGAGVVLTAHAMFIAAYLVHEACHDTIFKKHAHNRAAGELMSFVAGASYASYERIRHLHLRHHRERLDVSCFDYRAFLLRAPAWVRRIVLALEWAYVPAVEVLMHLQVIVRPFVERSQRKYLRRVLVVLALRGSAWVALFVYAPRVFLLYCVAYGLFLTALAFFDAFQHTYECYFEPGATPPDRSHRSREYEQVNTFSNLVSVRFPWLNVLALNFGYHNAHHERTGTPWYRLPALHRELFPESVQVLPVRELVRTFHDNRVRRVFDTDYGAVAAGPGRGDAFVGAHGVSLLSVV